MRTAQVTTALIVAGSVLLSSGCGSIPAGSTNPHDSEPVTARSVAFIASEHLTQTPSEAHSGTDFDELGAGWVGTELEFKPAGGRQVPRFSIAVGTDQTGELTDCTESAATCVTTRGVTLKWQRETPEEDPGGVEVVAVKGDTVVAMFQSGESILGDPRKQDLQISVTTMIDIATDPRLNATTSGSAVDAGEHLPFWKGKDSSPEPGPRVSEPPSP